jgi:hypothetical protein
MSEPKPLALSDNQQTSLLNAAQPLLPPDRSAFLVAVAAYFAGRTEIGDGELHRVVAELQRVYFKAPQADAYRHAPQQLVRKIGRPVGATARRRAIAAE